MGLFSRNYDRDRVSIQQLKSYIEANGLRVSSCQDNGTMATLVVDTVSTQLNIIYKKELSMTTLSPYDMYYDGPYTQEQIRRIIVEGINMPSVDVKVARIGNAFSFGLSISMNHRYFSLDEFDKNMNRLSDAMEKAGEVLEHKGILY